MFKNSKRNKYTVALGIVKNLAKEHRSLLPWTLLVLKKDYRCRSGYKIRGTIVQYVEFCVTNRFPVGTTWQEILG